MKQAYLSNGFLFSLGNLFVDGVIKQNDIIATTEQEVAEAFEMHYSP
ncbi:hypothetical protein JFL43_14915 [Viridibacillus sp. YIM B01967]|uniref:Uncharacterized protein n=1 Tax=Viridibacillus soli TaxID=2798301 RepID=A0ABS1H9P4_9BACL|nr:hypothetical protein [Viridibacillus soli]MBK3496126.1 hypothetical protein [Viridibacillus soli]